MNLAFQLRTTQYPRLGPNAGTPSQKVPCNLGVPSWVVLTILGALRVYVRVCHTTVQGPSARPWHPPPASPSDWHAVSNGPFPSRKPASKIRVSMLSNCGRPADIHEHASVEVSNVLKDVFCQEEVTSFSVRGLHAKTLWTSAGCMATTSATWHWAGNERVTALGSL